MTANEIERAYIYENEILDKNDPRRYFIDFIKNASKKDLKILDVGCACGILGAAIKSQNSNCKVYGIEYNSESISVAERKNCYENIIQADLNEFIKSPPHQQIEQFYNSFDFIIFGDVLEHLYEPERVLTEFKKFLKSDGQIFISIPNIANGSIKADLFKNNFNYTSVGILDKTHIRFFTYKTFAEMLANAELKIVHYEYTKNIQGTQPYNAYKRLPFIVKMHIVSDKHSYVLQYIVRCEHSQNDNLAVINQKYIDKQTSSLLIYTYILNCFIKIIPFKNVRNRLRDIFNL